jgi:hypothetical protein
MEMDGDYKARITEVEALGMIFIYYDVLDFGSVEF